MNAKVLPYCNEAGGSDVPKPPPLILLVEDEPALRDVIADIAKDAGLRIEVTGNYADGVVLLNASLPAVLITDVVLPDGDGHQLAEAAGRLGVPTLLISGYPDAIVQAEAGGIPFLAKPFGMADLQRLIRTLIEGTP